MITARPLRKLTVAAVALALVAVACGGGGGDASVGGEAASPEPFVAPAGEPAPQRGFDLFDGSTATLADYAGQPVVLNFWASWCPSCVAEMSAAFRPVQQLVGAEVTFVGMNIQDDRGLALDLLEETGVQWVNAVDQNGGLYIDLGGLGMPFTVFLNSDGEIVDEHNGPLSEGQLSDKITELFGVTT